MAFGVSVLESVCGDHSGLASYVWNYPVTARAASTRYLTHSRLGTIQYEVLPADTVGFAWSPIQHRDMVMQKTLGSTKIATWAANPDDLIIKEKWEANGLSMPWNQLLAIYELYHDDPDWDAGESLVWYPRDRGCTPYAVDIVNMLIDGEEFDAKWRGAPSAMQYRGSNCGAPTGLLDVNSAASVEVWYRLRPEGTPAVSVFLTEGSDTGETGLFETE